jgi:hypothetical protein
MSPERRPRPSPSKGRSAAALARLLALRLDFGAGAARAKLGLLAELERAALPDAAAVRALHEQLLFLAAYPDDAEVERAAERLLAGFSRRRDLARFRAELEDGGIVGTAIRYPFFWPTARRLARRDPERLAIDWASFDDPEELRPLALAALGPEELAWVREREPPVGEIVAALAGGERRREASALIARLEGSPGDDFARERLHDGVAPFYRLDPGPDGPSRTLDRAPRRSRSARFAPPRRGRPDLAAELARPPRAVIEVSARAGARWVELARDAMVVRSRDLDCFAYGDPRDVRRFVHDDGLEMVAIGSTPERRLALAAAYGVLTLRHGVPIGYVQLDGFLATALVHFNTFDTFRGADAAWVFARALATARALFGADAFAIEPYQLGRGNEEALDSGAFWFYAKLGFAPLDRGIAALARRERGRFARDPRARSSRRTLERLADGYLVFEPGGRSATVPPHAALARATTAALAAESADAAVAREQLAARAAALTGLAGARLAPAERLWLGRWAPMLTSLPGIESWPRGDRGAVGDLVRLKAGRRESGLVRAWLDHPRAGAALLELAGRYGAAGDVRRRDLR